MSTERAGYKLNYGTSVITSAALAFVRVLWVEREGTEITPVETLAEVTEGSRYYYHDANAGKLYFGVPGSTAGFFAEKVQVLYET